MCAYINMLCCMERECLCVCDVRTNAILSACLPVCCVCVCVCVCARLLRLFACSILFHVDTHTPQLACNYIIYTFDCSINAH